MFTVLPSLFSNNKIKSKLRSINKSKYGFDACIFTFDCYFFQLTILLKPDFNSCNSFALLLVDKVTTGT